MSRDSHWSFRVLAAIVANFSPNPLRDSPVYHD
jgi:hypothetical protein